MSAKQTVEQLAKNFIDIYNSTGKVEDLLPLYTSDVRYMVPGLPTAVGHANVKTTAEKYIKMKGVTQSSKMEMNVAEAHEAGNFLISTGEYKVTSEGKTNDAGKFVAVFKQEGGKWKLYYDIVCP